MVLAHKNWLFLIFSCISSITQFAALPIWTWTQTTMIRKRKNHLHQEEGNSNFNFNANLIFFKNGSKKKRTSVMEAGTGSRVMSPIQYRCKMAVTNADAGPRGSLLVGPVDQSGWFNFCWILVKKMINWTFKIFIVQLFF